MRKTRVKWVGLAALLFAVFAARDAAAENETIKVKSMAETDVRIVFFSQDRHKVWPNPGLSFDLKDYKDHDIKLACIKDEQICYGAWVTNTNRYWGVGRDGKATCRGCCYKCEGRSTREIVLHDPVRR